MSLPSVRSVLFTARVYAALTLLLPLLWLRLLAAAGERRRFLLVRTCARRVLRVAGCQVTVKVDAKLPHGRPAMFVANHSSLADAAVLLAALPVDLRFVANHVYARYPILGAAIRSSSAHIVDRESWRSRGECGRTMVSALRAGQSLLVFPEGTTSNDGRLLPFRNGAFRAAVMSGTPVVPVAVRGTSTMLPSGSLWLQNVLVRVDVLPALCPDGTTRAAVADLKRRASDVIATRLSVDR